MSGRTRTALQLSTGALAVVLALGAPQTAVAAPVPLATWTLNGSLNSALPLAVSATHPDAFGGALSVAGVTPLTATNTFAANNWPSGALDAAKYFEFSVGAANGQVIEYSSILFSLWGPSTGSSSWLVRSDVDNYGSNIATGSSSSITGGGAHISADVSAVGFRAGVVTFRVYLFSNIGLVNPTQRGMRGSLAGGQDLRVYGYFHTPLARWALNGSIDSSLPRPATATVSGVNATPLTTSGLTPTTISNGFLTTAWPAAAVDLNKYMSFSVTALPGNDIVYSRVLFSLFSTVTGTARWQLRSSVDFYSGILASGQATELLGNGTPFSADVSALGQRPGTVTFRLYFYSNTGTAPVDRRGIRGSAIGGEDLHVVGTTAVAGPFPFAVTGFFKYQDRLWDAAGYTGLTQDLPARYCDVEIVDASTQTVMGTGSTSDTGRFAIDVEANGPVDIYARVLSSTSLHPTYRIDVSVTGDAVTLHAVPTSTTVGFDPTSGDPLDMGVWLMEDTDGTGVAQAFHILDCGVDAWDWLAQPMVLSAYPTGTPLHFRWSPAGTAAGSFYNGAYIQISEPGSGDTNGWADTVILHETGHWVAHHFHQDDNPGGTHFIGDVFQDPRLSYGEGYATFLCAETREFRALTRGMDQDVSLYADLTIPPPVGTPGGLGFCYDFETGLYGNGTAVGQAGQACETSVTSAMWDIVDGPASPDLSPGSDDDVLDDDSSHVWPVLLNYMAVLPPLEEITLEDFAQGWRAINGPGYEAAALDQIWNDLNLMGFESDAQEIDDTSAQAATATVGAYALMGAGGQVVLNEIELGAEDAVEVYNSSSASVDLTNWKLVTSTNTTAGEPTLTFTFPAKLLPPGGMLYVRERGSSANDTDLDLYGGTFSIPWSNGTPGSCELRNGTGTPVDFLRWDGPGTPSTTPVPAGLTFTGSLASPPGGTTLQRDASGTDTDTAADFIALASSPAQPNRLPSAAYTSFDAGDQDWVRLPLVSGNLYSVRTFALMGAADTFLELYRPDGTTLIAGDDDRGPTLPESRLTFIAPSTGDFFARVTHVGTYTQYGMYRLRVFQHPSSDLMLPPTSVLASAQHGTNTGDQVVISWLNSSTYDQVQVQIQGSTPSSQLLPGGSSQMVVALNQGVHTIAVHGIRSGNPTTDATGWVYAGLIPTTYSNGFEDPALPDFGKQGTWGTTTEIAATGTRSATDTPVGNSPDNSNTSLELRVPVQLGGAGLLTFTHICISEATFDFGRVEITADDGATWTQLAQYDMDSYPQWSDGVANPGDWASESLSLAAYVGQRVRVRFRLETDPFVNFDGWYVDDLAITSDQVTDVPTRVPLQFALQQNQPNPFNPRTTIGFALPEPSRVRLSIFDARGRRVRQLIDETRPAGRYDQVWDGTDDRGQRLASGVYLYRLEAGAFEQTRKLVLVE